MMAATLRKDMGIFYVILEEDSKQLVKEINELKALQTLAGKAILWMT